MGARSLRSNACTTALSSSVSVQASNDSLAADSNNEDGRASPVNPPLKTRLPRHSTKSSRGLGAVLRHEESRRRAQDEPKSPPRRKGVLVVELRARKRQAEQLPQTAASYYDEQSVEDDRTDAEDHLEMLNDEDFFHGINQSILPQEGTNKQRKPVLSIDENMYQAYTADDLDGRDLGQAQNLRTGVSGQGRGAASGQGVTCLGNFFNDIDMQYSEMNREYSLHLSDSSQPGEHTGAQDGIEKQVPRRTTVSQQTGRITHLPTTTKALARAARTRHRNKAKVCCTDDGDREPETVRTISSMVASAKTGMQSRQPAVPVPIQEQCFELEKNMCTSGISGSLLGEERVFHGIESWPEQQVEQATGQSQYTDDIDNKEQASAKKPPRTNASAKRPRSGSRELPTDNVPRERRSKHDIPAAPEDDKVGSEVALGSKNHVVALVKLKKELDCLISAMGKKGWTHYGTGWATELIVRSARGNRRGKTRIQRGVQNQACKALLGHIYDLWVMCHNAPNAPDLEAQAAYFAQRERVIQKYLMTITNMLGKVSDMLPKNDTTGQQPAALPQSSVNLLGSVCRKLVPMLVLALKEAALLGGASVIRGEEFLTWEGQYASWAIHLLVQIGGWIERIYNSIPPMQTSWSHGTDFKSDAALRVIKAEARARHIIKPHLDGMREKLKQALDELDEIVNGPTRRRMALEKDRIARLERDTRDQEQREARDRRMRLFLESLRSGSSVASLKQQPCRSTQPTPLEEYAGRHDGWQHWEDDRLLGMIRKVARPNIEALTEVLIGRKAEEILARIGALKGTALQKYEASGLPPPRWCYQQS